MRRVCQKTGDRRQTLFYYERARAGISAGDFTLNRPRLSHTHTHTLTDTRRSGRVAVYIFLVGGMAARSRRAWFSVLLGLVLGFTLASRLILPRATELKKAGQRRSASGGGGCGVRREHGGGMRWSAQGSGMQPTEQAVQSSHSFLFVGVMTAQKYLNSRAVAAHR